MTSLQDWLPSYLVPFFTLSSPVPAPANPDSFPDFRYYNVDKLDACIVITCILTMAILRDATRLGIMEPFARWKLTRDLARRKKVDATRVNGNGKANGVVNGNGNAKSSLITDKEARQMRRSVLRFAEQSWALIYYTCSWGAGLVRAYMLFETIVISSRRSISTEISRQNSSTPLTFFNFILTSPSPLLSRYTILLNLRSTFTKY